MSEPKYVDPTPDPQFPDRPTDPQFYILSHLLQDMDGDSGRWSGEMQDFAARNGIDSESLIYVAHMRAKFALSVLEGIGIGPISDPDLRTGLEKMLVSMHLDGFVLGYEFAKERLRQFSPGDGQARAEAIRRAGQPT